MRFASLISLCGIEFRLKNKLPQLFAGHNKKPIMRGLLRA